MSNTDNINNNNAAAGVGGSTNSEVEQTVFNNLELFQRNSRVMENVLSESSVSPKEESEKFITWIQWLCSGNGPSTHLEHFFTVSIPRVVKGLLKRTYREESWVVDAIGCLEKIIEGVIFRMKRNMATPQEVDTLTFIFNSNAPLYIMFGHDLSDNNTGNDAGISLWADKLTVGDQLEVETDVPGKTDDTSNNGSSSAADASGNAAGNSGNDNNNQNIGENASEKVDEKPSKVWRLAKVLDVSPTNTEIFVEFVNIQQTGSTECTWLSKEQPGIRPPRNQLNNINNNSSNNTSSSNGEVVSSSKPEPKKIKEPWDTKAVSPEFETWIQSISEGDLCDVCYFAPSDIASAEAPSTEVTDSKTSSASADKPKAPQNGEWTQACVIKIDKDTNSYLVTFIGYSTQIDLAINPHPSNISPLNSRSFGKRGTLTDFLSEHETTEAHSVFDYDDPTDQYAVDRPNLFTSSYLISNVNSFYRLGGLEAAEACLSGRFVSTETSKIHIPPSIPLVRSCMLALSSTTLLLTRSFMNIFHEKVRVMFEMVLKNINSDNVRQLSKDNVDSIFNSVRKILRRGIPSRRRMLELVENYSMLITMKRLESESIEQRLHGIDFLVSLTEVAAQTKTSPNGICKVPVASVASAIVSKAGQIKLSQQHQMILSQALAKKKVMGGDESAIAEMGGMETESTVPTAAEAEISSASSENNDNSSSKSTLEFNYRRVQTSYLYSCSKLAQLINQYKLIEPFFIGKKAHRELVRRSVKLVKLLIQEQQFTNEHLNAIQTCATIADSSGDDDMSNAVYFLMSELVSDTSTDLSVCKALLQGVKERSSEAGKNGSQPTSRDQQPQLSKNAMNLIAKTAQLISLPSSYELGNEALELLWSLFLSSPATANGYDENEKAKANENENVNELAGKYIEQVLAAPQMPNASVESMQVLDTVRRRFMERSVQYLKTTAFSVNHILSLLRHIIEAYQVDPVQIKSIITWLCEDNQQGLLQVWFNSLQVIKKDKSLYVTELSNRLDFLAFLLYQYSAACAASTLATAADNTEPLFLLSSSSIDLLFNQIIVDYLSFKDLNISFRWFSQLCRMTVNNQDGSKQINALPRSFIEYIFGKLCGLVSNSASSSTQTSGKEMEMEISSRPSLINLIGLSGYRCFEEYFFSLNTAAGLVISDTTAKNTNSINKNKNVYHAMSIDQEIEEDDPNTVSIRERKFVITTLGLTGYDTLWKIALQTPYPKVTLAASLDISAIQQASAGVCDIGETRKLSIENCLNEIQNAMKTLAAEYHTSSLRISRSLMLLEAMIRESESELASIFQNCGDNPERVLKIWSSVCPHSQSSRGGLLSLTVHDSVRTSANVGKKSPFTMYENDPAWLVRYKLAKLTGTQTNDLRMYVGGAEVTPQMDARAVSILRGFVQGATVLVSLRPNAPDVPAANANPPTEEATSQTYEEVSRILGKLPSHILSSSEENFELFFTLLSSLLQLNANEASKNDLIQKTWDLIQLLPTNSGKLQAMLSYSPVTFKSLSNRIDEALSNKMLRTDGDVDLSPIFNFHYILSLIFRLIETNKQDNIDWIKGWLLTGGLANVRKMLQEIVQKFSSIDESGLRCDSCLRQVILEAIRIGLLIVHEFTLAAISKSLEASQNNSLELLKTVCNFSLLPVTATSSATATTGNAESSQKSNASSESASKSKEVIITSQDVTWILEKVFDETNEREMMDSIIEVDLNQSYDHASLMMVAILCLSRIESRSDEVDSNAAESDDQDSTEAKKKNEAEGPVKILSVQQILLSRSANLELDDCRLCLCQWISAHLIHPSLFSQFVSQKPNLMERFLIDTLTTSNRGAPFRVLMSKGIEIYCDYYGYLGGNPTLTPLGFFLELLMKNLPVYNGYNQPTCVEFFDLTRKLLDVKLKIDSELPESFNTDIATLTIIEQLKASVHNAPIMEGEAGSTASLFRDDILIGNLNLLKTALSYCSVEHREQMAITPNANADGAGTMTLMDILFTECLFSLPEAELSDNEVITASVIPGLSLPKCKRFESIHAALDALHALCHGSNILLIDVTKNLVPVVERVNPRLIASGPSGKIMSNSWNVDPEQDKRFPNGFSGLRNLGCICYMNSLIQQFNMIPRVRYGILNSRSNDNSESPITPEIQAIDFESENLLLQLQIMFTGLHMSLRQAFIPRGWTQSYKTEEGEPVNVLQQQDAQEFFNTTCDRLDDLLKGTPSQGFFAKALGVTIANELICLEDRSLPVRDNVPSTWYCLSLSMGHSNLAGSLKEFVAGDILNDYKWDENDNRTVKTLKRSCIGGLNDTFVLHLKRFCMNWETMMTEKLNDRFEFPVELDMFPYTKEGLAWEASSSSSSSPIPKSKFYPEGRDENYYKFELVGIVVHSGANLNSGHYYSYIKAREGRNKGKWFEFNDSTVRSFNINNLAERTFGGARKQQSYSPVVKKFSDVEVPVVDNAYMLFYERTTSFGSDSEFVLSQSPNSQNTNAAKDVRKCLDNHEVFPARLIHQIAPQKVFDYIWNDNMRLISGRQVLNTHFSRFVQSTMNSLSVGVARELNGTDESALTSNPEFEAKVSQIIEFLELYLSEVLPWTADSQAFSSLCDMLDNLYRLVPKRSTMFLLKLVTISLSGTGENNKFADLLLSAPDKNVRQSFALLIFGMVKRYVTERNYRHQQNSQGLPMAIEFESCLVRALLAVSVIDACAQHWRQFNSYWWLLHGIAKFDPVLCRLFAIYGAPVQIVDMMIGLDTFSLNTEPDTPLGKYLASQRRRRPNIGGYYDAPEWEHAIALFSATARCFDIQSDEKGIECIYDNGVLTIIDVARISGIPSTPRASTEHDLPIDFVLKRSMLCKAFYAKALLTGTDISSEALGKVLAKFSRNWVGYSNSAIELVYEGIDQSGNIGMIRHYFRVLYDLLMIDDTLTRDRSLFFISGRRIAEESNNTTANEQNNEIPNLTNRDGDDSDSEEGLDIQDIDLTIKESFFAIVERHATTDVPFSVECIYQLLLLMDKMKLITKLLSKDLNLFVWAPLITRLLQAARVWVRDALDKNIPTATVVSGGTETTNVPIAPVAAAVTAVAPDPSNKPTYIPASANAIVGAAAAWSDTEKKEFRVKLQDSIAAFRKYLNGLGFEEILLEGSGLLEDIDQVTPNDGQDPQHMQQDNISFETSPISSEMLSSANNAKTRDASVSSDINNESVNSEAIMTSSYDDDNQSMSTSSHDNDGAEIVD